MPQSFNQFSELATAHFDKWITATIKFIPNIGVAFVILILFYLIATFVGNTIRNQATKKDRNNLGDMLGGLAKSGIVLVGITLAVTIVFPTITPGKVLGSLGIGSVAIGFAFKDVLQNWLAGLLILLRQPFEVGDQILVSDYKGTVQRIETRATIIRDYDGGRIVIPNNIIYNESVTVKTAHDHLRSQYDVGVGYGDDVEDAVAIIEKALSNIKEIEQDPKPEALIWDLAASWVTIRVRWWTDSMRSDVTHSRPVVILAIKKALDEAGIDMPYDTIVHLLHDQTEADDGDRSKQREGWPAPKDGQTKSRWQAENQANNQENNQIKNQADKPQSNS